MREETTVLVKEAAYNVSIISRAKCTDMQLVEWIDSFEKVESSRSKASVIPR